MRTTNFAAYGLGALLLAVVFASTAQAQTTPISPMVGGWGGNNAQVPFNLQDPNHGCRYQVVYGRNEGDMPNVSQGCIVTALEYSISSSVPTWYWNQVPVLNLENLMIRIGYTSKDVGGAQTPNALDNANFNNNFKPDTYISTCLAQSYSPASVTYPGLANGGSAYFEPGNLIRFTLTRPFAWNGGINNDNILVDISFTRRIGSTGMNFFSQSGRTIVYKTGAGVNAQSNSGIGQPNGNSYMSFVCSFVPTLDVQPYINIFNTTDWSQTSAGGTGRVVTPANATADASQNWTGDGLVVGKFSIVNPFGTAPSTIQTISIKDQSFVNGGDATTAYTHPTISPSGNEYGVRLWRDNIPYDGVFDPATDVPIYDVNNPPPGLNFTVDGGEITFPIIGGEQNFIGGAIKTYFIVVKLAGAEAGSQLPRPGDRYQMRVSGVAVPAGVTEPIRGVSTGPDNATYPFFPGIDIEIPTFDYTDVPLAVGPRTAYLASQNNVLQAFDVTYARGPKNFQNTLTIQAPDEDPPAFPNDGDDSVDYIGIRLVLDKDLNNAWTPGGVDEIVATIPANHFPQDDGSASFVLPTAVDTDAGVFIAPVTKRFLILVDFNTIGLRGSTYKCQVTASGGHQFGAQVAGIPCPMVPVPGLVLEGNDLILDRTGPMAPDDVVSNISQGPNGWGELLLMFDIGSLNRDWSATDIVFTAVGTGTLTANPATAFSEVALYEDLNANAPNFDGPAIDQLATPLTGSFQPSGVNTATYSATLLNQSFVSQAVRRFYLRVKMGGQALYGERYYCNVSAVTFNMSPSGGAVFLNPDPNQPPLPPSATSGLVIDAPTLTITNAPTSPLSQIVEAGLAFGHTIAVFRFQAENEAISISGLSLATGGTGDFFTDIDAGSGIEIWLDSEIVGVASKDGIFTPGVDVLLGHAGGNYPLAALPFNDSGAIVIPNGQYYDLIIRYNILATAGGSLPETFRCSIASPADILTPGTNQVIFGVPPPISNTVGVIIYVVSSFTPTVGLRSGGAPITISGAGFTPPVSCTIGGVPCPGSPIINATGTQIVGFLTPAGDGLDLPIVLTTGALGSREVPMSFNYATASIVNEHQARLSSKACAADASAPTATIVVVVAFAAIVGATGWSRRRRRNEA